jgi:hypothetical protein
LLQQQNGAALVANTGSAFLQLLLPEGTSMGGKVGFRAKGAKGIFYSLRILGNTQ